MKTIKKVITETTIYAAIVGYVNNKLTAQDLQPLVTNEKVKEGKAVKLIQDNFPEAAGKTICIKAIETETVIYSMDEETFMKYAKREGNDEPEEVEG